MQPKRPPSFTIFWFYVWISFYFICWCNNVVFLWTDQNKYTHLNSHRSKTWGLIGSLLNLPGLFLLPIGSCLSTYPAFFSFPSSVSIPAAPSFFWLDIVWTRPTRPTFSFSFYLLTKVSIRLVRISALINQFLFGYHFVFFRNKYVIEENYAEN